VHETLGIMGTPGVSFVSLIIIGGSWIGSELATLGHFAVRHSIGHFVAALVGSVVVLVVWQFVHGRRL
jgi:uncharacterized membrane protein YeaQ/YmgE (transglycosylase-associated protein family)